MDVSWLIYELANIMSHKGDIKVKIFDEESEVLLREILYVETDDADGGDEYVLLTCR